MDKFLITLKSENAKRTNFFKDIGKHIVENKGEHSYENVQYISGNIENLKVRISNNWIKIGYASLCKFYKRNNVENMTHSEIVDAFDKLSDLLHLNLDKALVNYFEYARNIITKYNTSAYINHFGTLPKYERSIFNSSLYYDENKITQFVIYDKAKEQNRSNNIIHIPNGVNLTRLERRYHKGLAKYFSKEVVNVQLVKSKKFYNEICLDWYSTYKSINKINDVNLNLSENIKTLSNYRDALILQMINKKGLNEEIENINIAAKNKLITKKQKFDRLKYLHQIYNLPDLTFESPLIKEFDKLVDEEYLKILNE
jgi:hypothetical protein